MIMLISCYCYPSKGLRSVLPMEKFSCFLGLIETVESYGKEMRRKTPSQGKRLCHRDHQQSDIPV